jgi:hypothetical protein
MPPEPEGTRSRLREWWRVHYMERGFRFMVPGFQRRVEKDLHSARMHFREIAETYPVDWWFAIYNGNVYAAPTCKQVSKALAGPFDRDRVPRGCRMAPRPINGWYERRD